MIRQGAVRIQKEAVEQRLERYNTSSPTKYVVGEMVLLKRHHDDRPAKLDSLWLGPYKIIEELTPLVYRLQHLFDPERVISIHHMRLRPFMLREDVTIDQLLPLVDADDGETLVERVVSHTGYNKKDVRFRIRWTGYSEEHDTDEPWSHVDGNVEVTKYIEANPELKHLLTKKKRG